MKEEEKKLYKLIEYIEYLLNEDYKIYDRLNKRHIKKIDKLLRDFCKEYTKKWWF